MSLPVVLLALQVAAAPVPALSVAEQRYLDARNAANVRFANVDPADSEQDRVLTQLTYQLREIIGPVSLAGIDGPGKAAYDGFEGLGSTEMADGLCFKWRESYLFVTTRALFARAAAAIRPTRDRTVDEGLVMSTVLIDAAYSTFAEVPVRHGSSIQLARASVGLVAQDIGAWPPDTLVVQVIRGDRVYVAMTRLIPRLEQVATCAAECGHCGEQDVFDAYRRCVGAVLPTRPSFAAVVRRAQAIVDALQADEPPHLPAERRAGEPK
jgi:hypothetical protein